MEFKILKIHKTSLLCMGIKKAPELFRSFLCLFYFETDYPENYFKIYAKQAYVNVNL